MTGVSVRNVRYLSEASFGRDSERWERSSERDAALIFWLLLDQAKSNDLLMMIRLIIQNRHRPINLLDKNQADHLMGKSHLT